MMAHKHVRPEQQDQYFADNILKYFLEWKFAYFDLDFSEFCSKG